MKKRIVSLLLTLSILFGMAVPTMTPQADAVFGAVLGTGLKMCTSIVNGCIKACQNDADKGAGKGVLAMFKYAAEDFTGINFGGSSGSTTQELVIQKVDLSQVEAELKSINTELQKNNAAIYQLQSTVSSGLRSLSQQMEGLSQQIKDTKTELQYSTYLDTFFDFFNEYYEGISYYDKLVTTMLTDGATAEYQKNIYDQFYQLQNVEYSGSLHSAVDKLGRYLQGNYIYSSPGSVVDILTQYYILGYKDSGMSEEAAREKAAENTQDMISYLYYAYVMGAYYEQAIALYQTGVIDENGGVYTTDFGTMLTQKQIDTMVTALWSSVELTAGSILADMRSNYHDDATIPLVYQTGEGTLLTRTVDYNRFAAEPGGSFWLEDPAEELKTYFADEFCDAFTGIAKLSIENGSTLTIHDDYYVHIKTAEELSSGSSSSGEGSTITPINPTPSGTYTEKLHVTFGGQTIHTYFITVYKETGGGTFAAGLGTEDYPYVVKTEVQFNSIKQHSDDHFVLKANLDYSNLAAGPIKQFTGSFDGNGYTISNCTIDATLYAETGCVGLFGEVTGTVRNLQVDNIKINAVNNCVSASSLTTKLYAGAIAGYVNGGSVLYCSVTNSSVSAAHNGNYGACHVGGAVGHAEKGTLTNVVCRDTSVSAYAKYESTASDYDAQYPEPNNPGWAVAGGLIGVSNLTDLIRCGYTQSEGSANKITANGGTGAIAGGLLGTFKSGSIEYRVTPKLCWATMATAPEVTSNYASVNKNCLRFGSVAGYCSCGMRSLYKYWDSYPEDLRSKFNSDRWWLDYEAVNVNTINKQAFVDFMNSPNTNNTDYLPYLAFDGFEELSDGSGLTPLFQFGSGDESFCNSLIDFPVRDTYVEGDYIDLSGLYSYQCVGMDKLSDIAYPYVRVSQGAELLNAPLTAGTHTIEFTTSNGAPLPFTITVLPASHIYLESFLKEPTCTEEGESIQTCLHCGAQKERKTVEKLGHDKVLIDQGYPATCTTNGKSPSYRCSRCGEEFGGGLILGFHIYSEHVDGYPATCTKDGMTDGYRCANCGEIGFGCEPIPATGEHRAVKVEGYAATCQATGLTDGEICGDCETVLKEQTVIPMTDHKTETTTVLEPTCVSGGVKQEKCTVCDKVIKLTNVKALGHDYKSAVTAPTCTEPGYTTHTCTRCGDSYTDSYVSPTDHNFDSGTITKAATCTAEGEMTYTCACGKTHTKPIPMIAHDYEEKVTAPTCEEPGYTSHTCTQCGASYVDSYTAPTNHHYGKGVVTKAATCTAEGEMTYTCTCGKTHTEPIPMIDHDYAASVTAPTCTEMGYTTHTCTQCGTSYTDSYTSPTGHHYGDGKETKAPTCTEEGEMTYTCTCGESYTKAIPTVAHKYTSKVIAPTCTEMGYTTHTCTRCGDNYADTYTAPKGHTWDQGKTVTAPTLISTGVLRQSCTVCGETRETVIPALDKCDGGMDCPSRKFKDVQGIEHWSHLGIDYVLRSSFFYGVTSERFAPNRPMTRAMLVVVMYRMEGQPSVEGLSHSFQDVPEGAWYENALIWACNNGIINGVTASTFDPNSNITRQQLAAILYRYAQLREYDVSDTADLSEFKDCDTVGKFAQPAMSWAVASGLVQGYTDGTLKPADSATRAQLAAILMRFMKNVVGK